MQGQGHELLADAALADDQDRERPRRQLGDALTQ